MNYTSVEQSKKLVELGLDPCTADMTWGEETSDLTKKFEWKVSAGLNVAIKDNLFSYRKGYVLPCWSIGALIEILPPLSTIEKFGKKDDIHYQISFRETNFASGNNATLIDVVFNCIVWLLENNYIKH